MQHETLAIIDDGLDAEEADGRLLGRYAERQPQGEEAFARLVHRHIPLVYSAALRRLGGDVHHAQDVAQAVFTELARQAPRLGRHPTLTGWLYTTTQHLVCHLLRAEQRRARREKEAHAMQQVDRGDQPDWRSVGPILDDALRELRERDRLTLLLRFFEGRSLRSIGSALGVSEDAARMRTERALDRLRRALARRGVTATAAALSSGLAAHALESIPPDLAGQVAVSALAGIGASTGAGAAASAGAASGLFTVPGQISAQLAILKTPILATSLAAALVAVPLVVQHFRLEARSAEVERLRQEAASLADLRAESERLRSLESAARDLEGLRRDQAELERLRSEANSLRDAAKTPLHGELAAVESDQHNAEARRDEIAGKIQFGRHHEAVVQRLKELVIAARIYANDHQDRLPRTLEEIVELAGPDQPEGVPFDQYEMYPQPRVISEREPQLFLFREKSPRHSPEGPWIRVYGLVDGSVQTISSESEDFTLAEQAWHGIASTEVPESLRDEPQELNP